MRLERSPVSIGIEWRIEDFQTYRSDFGVSYRGYLVYNEGRVATVWKPGYMETPEVMWTELDEAWDSWRALAGRANSRREREVIEALVHDAGLWISQDLQTLTDRRPSSTTAAATRSTRASDKPLLRVVRSAR